MDEPRAAAILDAMSESDGRVSAGTESTAPGEAPPRGGLVLVALILVAAVANLNLSVANVALPSIGKHFDSGQTTLDLIAVGYSLGLACSVLWLGAIGDRYGRKLLLLLGSGDQHVFAFVPGKEREEALLAQYHSDDSHRETPAGAAEPLPASPATT